MIVFYYALLKQKLQEKTHRWTRKKLVICYFLQVFDPPMCAPYLVCVFSRSSLLARDSIYYHEDGGINSVCIVEEASNDLLDVIFVGFIEFGTCVDWVSSLIVLAILDWIWVVGAMLQLCRMWMLVPE